MTGFFCFQRNLLLKLIPAFLNVGTIESFVSKAAIQITKASICRCFLKKDKSKKNKITGRGLLIIEWNKFQDYYHKKL